MLRTVDSLYDGLVVSCSNRAETLIPITYTRECYGPEFSGKMMENPAILAGLPLVIPAGSGLASGVRAGIQML
jgi:hypothetical protein